MRPAAATLGGLWLPAVLCLVLSTVGLAACGGRDPVTGTTSVKVQEGQDATVKSADGGITVAVPGDAIEGTGDLAVREVTAASGRSGWSVDMSNATLSGKATISFPRLDLIDGEPAPLVVSGQSLDSKLTSVADVKATEDGVVVTTDHFSVWFVEVWNKMLADLRGGLDRVYTADAAGKQPRCADEQGVRDDGFTITSDEGARVKWCLGRGQDGRPSLAVVNTRGYTVAAESSPGATPGEAGRDDVVTAIASLIRERPSLPGNTVTLVPPGGRLDFAINEPGDAGVRVLPSVPGYLVTAVQYAIDTLSLVLDRSGISRKRKAILRALDIESCLAGYSAMTTSSIENATEASNYLNDALATTLGCASEALTKLGLGGIAAPLAEGFTWIVAGLRTAANGFGAAADTALNPQGYQIIVSPPAPAELVFTPGAYGPLKAGMGAGEAVATGLVEQRDEPDCMGTVWMKPEHNNIHLNFDDTEDELFVLGSFEPGPTTDRGIGVGSTVDDLEQAYGPDLGAPEFNQYQQYVYTVSAGDGHLTFFLASDSGEPSPSSEVTALLASQGEPVTIYEGEGPC